jgi:hypothetical protein
VRRSNDIDSPAMVPAPGMMERKHAVMERKHVMMKRLHADMERLRPVMERVQAVSGSTPPSMERVTDLMKCASVSAEA